MTAKKDGLPSWAIDIQPEDAALARQKKMEAAIGDALMTIAGWAGQCATAGDKDSIVLMVRHVVAIIQTSEQMICALEKKTIF